MSSTYAGQPVAGDDLCRWRFHWEDVDLACRDRAIPGEALCADHYIESVHAAELRTWPAQTVPIPVAPVKDTP